MLLYNVIGVTVTAQSSAVHHTFLDASRTVLIWIVSVGIYYFVDPLYGEPVHWSSLIQLVGFVILIMGQLVYDQLLYVPASLVERLNAVLGTVDDARLGGATDSMRHSVFSYASRLGTAADLQAQSWPSSPHDRWALYSPGALPVPAGADHAADLISPISFNGNLHRTQFPAGLNAGSDRYSEFHDDPPASFSMVVKTKTSNNETVSTVKTKKIEATSAGDILAELNRNSITRGSCNLLESQSRESRRGPTQSQRVVPGPPAPKPVESSATASSRLDSSSKPSSKSSNASSKVSEGVTQKFSEKTNKGESSRNGKRKANSNVKPLTKKRGEGVQDSTKVVAGA